MSDRRYIHGDERGSVTAVTNPNSTVLWLDTHDEYGIPGANNVYKARIYSPTLGRFMQSVGRGVRDGNHRLLIDAHARWLLMLSGLGGGGCGGVAGFPACQ